MKKNIFVPTKTFEGGPSVKLSTEQTLSRLCMSCMLWEDTFYVDGKTISEQITEACKQVSGEYIAELAIKAKEQGYLRHLPLLLAVELLKKDYHSADILEKVITRPDDICELLSLYWEGGRRTLKKQLRKGIAKAFHKFDEYQLAKWNRKAPVKLRDAMILCHPKPKTKEQGDMWKRLLEDKLKTPKTRETMLSSGEGAKKTYLELMAENKLGLMACLKNLRTMIDQGIDLGIIDKYLRSKAPTAKILPFQFIKALEYAPSLFEALDYCLLNSYGDLPKLPGRTILLIDVSGSMHWQISNRSETMRIDAAAGLAMLAREMCESCRVFIFSDKIGEVPACRGLAMLNPIKNSFTGGTSLGYAVAYVNRIPNERVIVVTDEQTSDAVPNPVGKGYICNITPYRQGIRNRKCWQFIDGFSPHLLNYIAEMENNN